MKPKFLRVIDDKFHVHGDDNFKALTLQQGDLLCREGEPDRCIHIDRDDALKLRDALTEWLYQADAAGQTEDGLVKEKQVLVGIGNTYDGSPPVVMLGMCTAAWDYCKDGMSHDFDLSKVGLPVRLMIFGAPTQEACAETMQRSAATAGCSWEDQRKKTPTIGIDKPTEQ